MKYKITFLCLIVLFVILTSQAKLSQNHDFEIIDVATSQKDNSKTFWGIVESDFSSDLSFQAEGKIVFIPFSKGDYFKKGDVLARVDGELYKIRKNEQTLRLKEALIRKNKSKSYYERINTLHKVGAVSDNDWEEAVFQLKTDEEQIKIEKEKLNLLNKQIDYNMLIAPYNGYISEKYAQIGAYAKIGQPIFSIVSFDRNFIKINVDENIIDKIKLNQQAVVVYKNKKYFAKVQNISQADINSGGYIVKVRLNNTPASLKSGMNVEVKMNFDDKNYVVYIPLKAVNFLNNEKYVYKIHGIGNDLFEIAKHKIETGRILNENIEVLSGLNSDDVLIVGNFQKIEKKKVIKLNNEKR